MGGGGGRGGGQIINNRCSQSGSVSGVSSSIQRSSGCRNMDAVERIYIIYLYVLMHAVRSVIQQSTIVRDGMYVKGQLLVPGIVDSSGRRGARQCVGNKGLARGAGIRALV